MILQFKKVKAKVNPMLKIIAKTNKAPSDSQKKYPLKFSPRLSSVSLPLLLYSPPVPTQNIEGHKMNKKVMTSILLLAKINFEYIIGQIKANSKQLLKSYIQKMILWMKKY